jgi:amidophosphoribosyltransferase
VRFPCYYGIDTPSYEELAAARTDVEGIRAEVGADSLGYLPPEELVEAIGLGEDRLCTACFTGRYLEEDSDHELEL